MIPNQDQDQNQQLITTCKVSSSNSQSKINNMADSSNLESIGILVLLGTRDGQYKVSLKKVNDYYKNVTNSKTFNITENFSDFFNAFKSCNSIGTCSILTQVASNCYILYNNVKDIIYDREYHKKMIQFMIDNTGKIYNDINILHSFINYNNSYMYCYQNMSNVEIFKLIAQLQTKLCPDLLFNSLKDDTHKNIKFDSSLKKKIKVGFVSDFLSLFHSVSKDRLGIIKHLNNDSEFDVTIMTRKTTSPFYNKIIYGKDDADIKYNSSSNSNSNVMKIIIMDENDLVANRNQIADEQFDIIVYPEIGMCQKNRYIAYARLAPIQINTWGHSDTSGLPNIDYFVSSKYFNTPEDQYQYSEKLILFESLGTYYYNIFNSFNDIQLNDDNQIFRKKISEMTGVENPNIYGCIQICIKIHPTFVSMLDKILNRDENGVIVILSAEKDTKEDEFLKKYINKKIKQNNRIYFIYQAPFIEYINNVKNCDIILDYHPFGGLNSTIEAFLLGKICITLPGSRISGKFTQGLYTKMGINEFICNTEDEYVSKSIEYARDVKKRKKYEKCILDNVHKILEEKESVDEWKIFLKNLYYDYNKDNKDNKDNTAM
jgi:predicted O-linked N-acetylglucosamine transferase (SPINDLY family)